MDKTYLAIAPSDLLVDTGTTTFPPSSSSSSSSNPAYPAPESLHFLRLPHPRTGEPNLYLPYLPSVPAKAKATSETDTKESGAEGSNRPRASDHVLLEVSSVNPEDGKRSWFLEESVVSDGSLLLYTPIDPTFILIPLLLLVLSRTPLDTSSCSLSSNSKSKSLTNNDDPSSFFFHYLESERSGTKNRSRFLPLDDLIHEVATSKEYRLEEPFRSRGKQQRHGRGEDEMEGVEEGQGEVRVNEDLLRLCDLPRVRKVLKELCEEQTFPNATSSDVNNSSALPNTFYRPSLVRILARLVTKVNAVAQAMEPDVFPTLTRQLAKDGVDLQTLEAQVAKQAREKMAIQVVGLWLPGEVVQALIGEYNLNSLTDHLESQAALSFQMNAASSIPTTSTDKGNGTVKKPNTTKKTSSSRGVDALKKVNTQKMTKLTSFFKKKA